MELNMELPPVGWAIDSSGFVAWLPQEIYQSRGGGMVALNQPIPENWWTKPDILATGQYTEDRGRHWRPLTIEDK